MSTPNTPKISRARYFFTPRALVTGAVIVLPSCILDLPPVLDDEDGSMSGSSSTMMPPEPEPGPEPEPPDAGPSIGGSGGMDASMNAGGSGPGGGGVGGSAGSSGAGGGGMGGDGGMPPLCSPEQRVCDGECIGADEPCCPGGCLLDNAASECVDDACVVVDCEDGFFDCDGVADNGCERFPEFTPVTGSRVIARRINVSAAGDPFAGIPLHPLAAPCVDCFGDFDTRIPLPTQGNAGAPIGPNEIQAGFSVGWDDGSLYLRTQVFDDDIPAPPDGLDARYHDNVEFLFQGSDVRLIYLGFDATYAELDSRNEDANVTFIDPTENTASCYTLTVRLTRAFLDPSSPGVTLSTGAILNFNLAVNDWDAWSGAPMNPDRTFEQTAHLFHMSQGQLYWTGSQPFPELELAE